MPCSSPPSCASGHRSCGRRPSAISTRSRDTSRRCGRAAAARSRSAGTRLPIFYFTNASEIRGDGDPIHAPRGSVELDFELEVAAIVDTPGLDLSAERAEEVIGGYTIFDDFSARDLQREEMALHLGPAKGKDFASAFGPFVVTPDELADRRQGTGFDLSMTVAVNGDEIGRGRWADSQFSFGEMLERASADVRLRPGDLIGSGTVDTGCLLQTKDETLGRYLEPGDVVTLAIERLRRTAQPDRRPLGLTRTAAIGPAAALTIIRRWDPPGPRRSASSR